MNSSISTVCTLSTALSRKSLACLPLDTHCLGEKQRAGATVSAEQSPQPSWHSTTTALHLEDSDSLQRMQDAPLEGQQRAQEQQGHTARERTHSTSLFVCEQKATGQHLLVARKMSGSQLKLTFYKGVETETWMINFNHTVTRSVSSKVFLLLVQESENVNWNHD